jgi:hypothetical protein
MLPKQQLMFLFLCLLSIIFTYTILNNEQYNSINEVLPAASSFSISKAGNIRIGDCQAFYNEKYIHELFPSKVPPSEWGVCDDATTYTWRHDFERELIDVSPYDRSRLTASAGYCPHKRCQLGNASASDASGYCPPGLCYTKLENGKPSFGACCFSNGTFESHELIGYYYKSQPTPKPIYKRNRIVLGGNHSDISKESFINANEIADKLIAAQCPLTNIPEEFDNTIEDMKRLLIEQNVGIWVQLSPYSDEGKLMSASKSNKSFCEVFPLKYLNHSLFLPNKLSYKYDNIHQKGINQFNVIHHQNEGYYNMTYTLTAFIRRDVNNNSIILETIFDPELLINKSKSGIMNYSSQVVIILTRDSVFN